MLGFQEVPRGIPETAPCGLPSAAIVVFGVQERLAQ